VPAIPPRWCCRYDAYTGSDYYEIALVEYSEQMHSDLPPTKMRATCNLKRRDTDGNSRSGSASKQARLRGQWALAIDNPITWPIIVAKGRVHGIEADNPAAASRYRSRQVLQPPSTTDGETCSSPWTNPFGCRLGPALPGTAVRNSHRTGHDPLHGNNTIWISDGNVHQWITPANEDTPYPKGVSVRNVRIWNCLRRSGSGCQTFFYTNAQSARLQFYHDHALAITVSMFMPARQADT